MQSKSFYHHLLLLMILANVASFLIQNNLIKKAHKQKRRGQLKWYYDQFFTP